MRSSCMHLTPRSAKLLGIAALWLAILAAGVNAQPVMFMQEEKKEPIAPEPPKAMEGADEKKDEESDKEKPHLRVPLGEFFKLRAQSGLGIKDVFVDRDKVLKIVAFEKKASFVKAFGVGLGDARVTIVDMKDGVKTYRIRVAPSLEFLQRLVDRQFPASQLKITALGDDALFVEGNVDAPAHVDQVVHLLETCVGRKGRVINNIRLAGVTQVQLNICIARVDRRELRKINSNFLAANTHGFIGTQLGNLIGVPGIVPRGGDLINGGAKVFSPSALSTNQVLTGSSTVFFGVTNESSQLFGFLELLKQQGVVKVLANPTLVTTNGRPADFLVGGEQPVPNVIFAGGTTLPNVQFKSFGTRLTFVPVLLGDGKIRLDVQPEVSTVNFSAGINSGGISVPQFITQRLHTTVEMENGHTLYLGGLLQNEVETDVQKIPLLGDLPWAGVAFRKVSHQHRETELVVVVTPKLVAPMRENQRPHVLPGQESRDPSDYELYVKGRAEVAPPPPPLAHHHRNLTYPMPISIWAQEPTTDALNGPVFGPFGPVPTPKLPDRSEPSTIQGNLYGPFGPSVGYTLNKANAPTTAPSYQGLSTTGPINAPVTDAIIGTVTIESGPAPVEKRK